TDGACEAVAVDDGWRDASPELLRAWADHDPRVRVLAGPALGLVAALERARAVARGTWLARMDADDVAHPRRLAAQRAWMAADPTLAICGCGVRYVPRERLKGGALRYERWLNGLTRPEQLVRDLFVECPIAHPAFFMRTDAVVAVGGYRDRGWPEDYDLVLRLWRAGGRLGNVPEVLLDWRDGPARLSRTHPSYAPAAFARCKAHHLCASLARGRDGFVVWGAGPVGKPFARALREQGAPVRAFVDLDPRKIGQRIGDAPVVAPDGVDAYRGALCVAAVGEPGAREKIRGGLAARGREEGRDFVAVA